MKYFLLIIVMFIFGCGTTRVIYRPFIPKIVCPDVITPIYEKLNKEQTKKEMLIIVADNLEKSIRYIQELKIRLECFEKTIDKYSKENLIKEIEEIKLRISYYENILEVLNENG